MRLSAGVHFIFSTCRSAEFLGFNNRTCTTSLRPDKTAGPVLRGAGSFLWREWALRVLKKEINGQKRIHVSLQAYVDPKVDDAKCLGFMSNFYDNPGFSGTCFIPPYGNGLFLNGTQDTGCEASTNPQVWWVLPASSGAEGEFELQAANKPDTCTRTLAVEDCGYQAVMIQDPERNPTVTRKYKTWKLTRRYDATRSPPPPNPVPVPSPPPVVPEKIPAPIISGPSSTSSGYATVIVDSPGGSSACSVESLVLSSYSAGSPGNVAGTAQISATQSSASVPVSVGYNSIYATGICAGGQTTERSNGLTVFYQPGVVPVPVPIPIIEANLFGTNSGIFNIANATTYTKLPIASGTYKSLATPLIEKVSMSGKVAAQLVQIAGRRRRMLLSVLPPQVEICSDITASTPVFIGMNGTELILGFNEISLSGTSLSAISNNTLYYYPSISSPSYTTDTSNTFEKVSMSGSAVLTQVSTTDLQYAPNIASPSWQQITTTGMDWSCGGEIALSGKMAAAIDTNNILYYKADITSSDAWIAVPMPTNILFQELSLTGKQIACTDTSSSQSGDNVWYAKDITAITGSSDWTNVGGALRSIAISTP